MSQCYWLVGTKSPLKKIFYFILFQHVFMRLRKKTRIAFMRNGSTTYLSHPKIYSRGENDNNNTNKIKLNQTEIFRWQYISIFMIDDQLLMKGSVLFYFRMQIKYWVIVRGEWILIAPGGWCWTRKSLQQTLLTQSRGRIPSVTNVINPLLHHFRNGI